jgi:hypothetical protein
VVQTAAKLVLEPLFEADLERIPMATVRDGAQRALSRKCSGWGYTDVADLISSDASWGRVSGGSLRMEDRRERNGDIH